MFTDGFGQLLANNPAIAALVGTGRRDLGNGVYPMIAPDEVTLPYVVYAEAHRETINSFQGVNRLIQLRFQVSVYGANYDAAKTIAKAVKDLLDGFTGTLSDGTVVSQTLAISEHDEVEQEFKATLYGVVLDYYFWVVEPL